MGACFEPQCSRRCSGPQYSSSGLHLAGLLAHPGSRKAAWADQKQSRVAGAGLEVPEWGLVLALERVAVVVLVVVEVVV